MWFSFFLFFLRFISGFTLFFFLIFFFFFCFLVFFLFFFLFSIHIIFFFIFFFSSWEILNQKFFGIIYFRLDIKGSSILNRIFIIHSIVCLFSKLSNSFTVIIEKVNFTSKIELGLTSSAAI